MFTSEKKDTYIKIRLTEAEKKAIEERAKEKDTNISKYIRGLIKEDIEGANNDY